MGAPGLDDGQDVLDADIQRVMPSEVLRTLHDDARSADPIGKGLEFDFVRPEGQGHADLFAPFRPDLVGLDLFSSMRRGADEIPRQDEVVEMPEVVRVLPAPLDFPRLRVPMEDAHRIAAMEPILISVCRARISIRSSQRPSRANLKTSDVAGPADGSGAVPSPGGSRRVHVSGDPRGETGLRSAPPSVREGPESVAMDLDALRPRVHLRRRLRPGGGRFRRIEDRKSTRLNSSHSQISYAVFCLKKK